MSLYIDSSAYLKRYLDEPDSSRFVDVFESDPAWVCARHTMIEVRRILARVLRGAEAAKALRRFAVDWERTDIVELDSGVCDLASEFAMSTGARTLDALHLAAAHRVGAGRLTFVTADVRLAQAARSVGWMVLGA